LRCSKGHCTSLPGAAEKSAQNQGKYEIRSDKQEVENMKTENSGNMPEKKFSTGAVSAVIWKNTATSKRTGTPVDFRTIQLDRRYKDKDGSWKSTGSLRVNDLPKAALVLSKAYEYLVMREQDAPHTDEAEIEEEIVM
jgi:hypothetical protein